MGKKVETTGTSRGEELLREWAVADEPEALRAAWGRDPEADLAIAVRLGSHPAPETAALLVQLEGHASTKAVRKEIRRALFRLEQRGVTVPKKPSGPPVTIGAAPLEGLISPFDGGGDQFIWLLKPGPAGLAHLFAVINDPGGLREVELNIVTRKALRAMRDELEKKHEIRLVEIDWRYCDHRLAQAHQWAVARGASVTGDYSGLRNQILRDPPKEVPHPIFSTLDAEAIRADPLLLEQSGAVPDEPEFRTWFYPEAHVRPYLDEIEQAMTSPLLLNRHQQQERVEQIMTKAITNEFGGDRQPSYVRRLLDMAYVFHATQRPAAAKQTLAAALALEASTRGGVGIPLCEVLVRFSIGAHVQAAAAKQEEQAKTSLIMTPQEALAASQRQRS